MDETCHWYAARIVLESVHAGDEVEEPLFEERIILVKADSDEQALQKAERFGSTSGEEYKNEYGNTVAWVFREVLEVKPLFDEVIDDGSEVYYSFIGRQELDRLRQVLKAGV